MMRAIASAGAVPAPGQGQRRCSLPCNLQKHIGSEHTSATAAFRRTSAFHLLSRHPAQQLKIEAQPLVRVNARRRRQPRIGVGVAVGWPSLHQLAAAAAHACAKGGVHELCYMSSKARPDGEKNANQCAHPAAPAPRHPPRAHWRFHSTSRTNLLVTNKHVWKQGTRIVLTEQCQLPGARRPLALAQQERNRVAAAAARAVR